VLRLFRPGYAAHLVGEWPPALDGVADKLQAGASVADVGCGLGEVLREAGFSRVRRATQTPFNLILEARP
jgi:hypothetical protein